MQSTYNGMIQHKTPITENKQKFGVLGLNHVVEPPPTARWMEIEIPRFQFKDTQFETLLSNFCPSVNTSSNTKELSGSD